jgi:hypothetical protein
MLYLQTSESVLLISRAQRWNDPTFLNFLVYKKTFPLYLSLQLVPLVGVMNLPF